MGERATWRSSLAIRLTGWYTLATLLLLGAATGLLYWALAADLDRDSDLFLADKVNVVRTILRERPEDWSGLREEIELESAARRYAQFYIRLLDDRGRPVLETPGMERSLAGIVFPTHEGREPSRGFSVAARDRRPFRLLTADAPVGRSAGGPWIMQIALDRAQEVALLGRYRRWLWFILLTALGLCPFVGYRIAKRGIRPVETIAESARRIGSSTLNERIDPEGYPVELAALATTFNAMLDRLETSFSRLSEFSADIAHELRTPVNNIRGEAEVALTRTRSADEYREVLSSCLEEAVKLSDLIGNLLFLARSESPRTDLRREVADLGHVLEAVHEYFEAVAMENGIYLLVECEERTPIFVDRILLQRALGNLVSNALVHTGRGGTVTLRGFLENGAIGVQVRDNGVGIPSEALPRVFDRFFRVDRARSSPFGGTGLGLPIVKGIVSLHGGTASIESSAGLGTTVTLTFPFPVNATGDLRTSPPGDDENVMLL